MEYGYEYIITKSPYTPYSIYLRGAFGGLEGFWIKALELAGGSRGASPIWVASMHHMKWVLGVILGLYWDDGKENGNYYSILGLYWDNGK